MGHKVNPNGFRLGIIKGWESRWYANRNYKDLFSEDRKLRDLIRKRLHNAAVSRIEIERVAGTQLALTIHTAKPGIVIGKSGESVERLRQDLEKLTKKKVRLNILEIRNPDVDAYLVAKNIAEQLEKRVSFRRAMKQAVQKSMRAGAKGIKVVMGGRLGGAEIARTEKEVDGSVPLQTLRANIDYGLAEAHTTFGVIGVKAWIYHGDVLPEKVRKQGPQALQPATVLGSDRGDRGPRGDRGDRGPRGDRGFGGGERGDRGDRGPRPGGPGGPGERGGERRPPRPVGAGGGAAGGAPRTGERRPPRPVGAGGPGAAGGAPGGAASRPAGGAGVGGERRPRPSGPAGQGGASAESRPPEGAGRGRGSGPEREPREPRELPAGEIEMGAGLSLPSGGPVTPAPAGEHEVPAPAASQAERPVEPATPPPSAAAPEATSERKRGGRAAGEQAQPAPSTPETEEPATRSEGTPPEGAKPEGAKPEETE